MLLRGYQWETEKDFHALIVFIVWEYLYYDELKENDPEKIS